MYLDDGMGGDKSFELAAQLSGEIQTDLGSG